MQEKCRRIYQDNLFLGELSTSQIGVRQFATKLTIQLLGNNCIQVCKETFLEEMILKLLIQKEFIAQYL